MSKISTCVPKLRPSTEQLPVLKSKAALQDLIGRVYLITGGTGSLGSEVVQLLASRGAAVILLCRDKSEAKTVAFVSDTKKTTKNENIFTEDCDLLQYVSVRLFVLRWASSKGWRRLDGIICCASHTKSKQKVFLHDTRLSIYDVNYFLQRFLIISLCPALLLQQIYQDVRVVIVTNSIYKDLDPNPREIYHSINRSSAFPYITSQEQLKMLSDLSFDAYEGGMYWVGYYQTQLALGLFGKLLQRMLYSKRRSDGSPSNIKVSIVDPGHILSRSFSRHKNELLSGDQKHFLLNESWFHTWLSKSCKTGAQSILYGLLSETVRPEEKGNYIRNCKVVKQEPKIYMDTKLQEAYNLFAEEMMAAQIHDLKRPLFRDQQPENKSKMSK